MGERARDYADKIHADFNETCTTNLARVEGLLDGPISEAVRAAGPETHPETGPIGCLLILNYVGRMLREAYGAEGYRKALDVAQADVHADLQVGVAERFTGEVTGMLAEHGESMARIARTYEEGLAQVVRAHRTEVEGLVAFQSETLGRSASRWMIRGAVAGVAGTWAGIAVLFAAGYLRLAS